MQARVISLFVLCSVESYACSDEATRLMGAEVDGINTAGYGLPLLAVAARVEEVIVTAVAYNLQLHWLVGALGAEEGRTYELCALLAACEHYGRATVEYGLAEGEVVLLVLKQCETCKFLVALWTEGDLCLGAKGVVLLAAPYGRERLALRDVGVRSLDAKTIARERE